MKAQNSNQELNFWILNYYNFKKEPIKVGSDLVKTQIVQHSDFEYFLLEMGKIGAFSGGLYTYKMFMENTDLSRINDLLNQYLKDFLPGNAQEFDLLHQSQKNSSMWDELPESIERGKDALYDELEGYQRGEVARFE